MPATVESAAILFADISGSTSLYDRLGDLVARELVARCLQEMTTEVLAHGGMVVKTIGDEIMATFPLADCALASACGIQTTLAAGMPNAGVALTVRIGVHYGSLIREAGDVFGDAVNVAARITAMALPGEILTSQETIHACDAARGTMAGLMVLPMRRAPIKGKEAPLKLMRVAPVDGTTDDHTRVFETQLTRMRRFTERLLLRYGDRQVTVDAAHTGAVLGRGDSCEIVVNHKLASRQHARIEFSMGRFVLADLSVNGTYVRLSDGVPVRLQRENLILRGAGIISLGQPIEEETPEQVRFEVARG
jgi:class 3 adenylate cyclase